MMKSVVTLFSVAMALILATATSAATIVETFDDESADQWGNPSNTVTTSTVAFNATTGSTITFDITITTDSGNLKNGAGDLYDSGGKANWFNGVLGFTADNFVVTGIPLGESLVAGSIKFGLTETFINNATAPSVTFVSDGTTSFALTLVDSVDTDHTLDTGRVALVGGNSGSYTATFTNGSGQQRYGNFDLSVEYELLYPSRLHSYLRQ